MLNTLDLENFAKKESFGTEIMKKLRKSVLGQKKFLIK